MASVADRPIDTAIAPGPRLRGQIDRSVTRALFDHRYKKRLLMDPTIAVADSGCPPHQFKTLGSIRALDLDDFARQVYSLFWRAEHAPQLTTMLTSLPGTTITLRTVPEPMCCLTRGSSS